MKDIEILIKDLKRWSEIAKNTFERGNWNECSLLHSFGDKLSQDIDEAIEYLKYEGFR